MNDTKKQPRRKQFQTASSCPARPTSQKAHAILFFPDVGLQQEDTTSTALIHVDPLMIDTKLNKVYNAIGLKRNLTGTRYLNTAIKLLAADYSLMHILTGGLYPKIALIHNKKSPCIERAIRNAIQQCCHDNAIALNGYFKSSVYSRINIPTNAEFIAMLYDDVMIDLCNSVAHSN